MNAELKKVSDALKHGAPNYPDFLNHATKHVKEIDEANYLIKKGDANSMAALIQVVILTLNSCFEYVPQGIQSQVTNRISRLQAILIILEELK